ncbi:hypothetical protein [uncultured Lacinutrix sp.]|uniref:hypothetical protein n=1 Tax=uncultured Lacinutrix sp. TaxID=574032 RepID=UPI00260FB938|nr:hypothetical protein [uncultured Lacinutrix sp.]
MKNILSLFVIGLILFSCNDGDIITEELEFDATFDTCGELLVFNTKTDPNESLSLEINSPVTTLESLFLTEVDATNPLLVNLVNVEESITIGTINRFNYRTYDANPANIFCNDVPASGINITQDYTASGGTATFTINLIEDDNDGIPAELEDINGDGNLDNDDTDGDGLPNYLDDDDDGDNVKTITEQPNYTEADGLSLAQNSDATLANPDNIPDYLDPDDDGDGILTIKEVSAIDDLNPTDDITDNNIGPDYLNEMITTSFEVVTYSSHTISQTFELQLVITDLSLPVLNQDFLNFGLLENATGINQFTREVTPTF